MELKLSKLKNVFKFAFIVIAIAFMAFYLQRNWGDLQNYDWQFDIGFLILSSVILWVAFNSATFMHKLIFENIAGFRFSFWQMFRIYNISNLGRYLPGKLWNVLGLFYLANEQGANKRQTTLAVIMNEIGYKGSAIIIGFLYLIYSPTFKSYLPFMILVLLIFLVIIHPRILGIILNFMLKLFKRNAIDINFSYATALKYIVYYFVVWFLHSLAFYFFVRAITPVESMNFIHFLTILPTCWIIGYIMLFAPGGIGVREGMLVLVLSEYIAPEIALVIAISQRLWFMIIEGINTLIALLLSVNEKDRINSSENTPDSK